MKVMMLLMMMLWGLTGVVCSQDDDDASVKYYRANHLYSIVNQWSEYFDSDLLINVWRRMIEQTTEPLDQDSCLMGLYRIVTAFKNNDTDATKYFDSWGKPGTALLQGSTTYWGYYDECINLQDTAINKTGYCRFKIIATLNISKQSIPLEAGLCYPWQCSPGEFSKIINDSLIQINEYINSSGLFPASVYFTVDPTIPVYCPWRDLDYDAGTIIMLVVCGLLVVLALLGSLVDGVDWYYEEWWVKPNSSDDSSITDNVANGQTSGYSSIVGDENSEENTYKGVSDESKDKKDLHTKTTKCNPLSLTRDFLRCFSLYKNVPAILATHQPEGAITCLNGIRVIGMFWIILSHAFVNGTNFQIANNPIYVREHSYTRFTFQVISNGFLAVDNFLLLSGMLITYLMLREMDRRKGKIPMVFFYLHRYVRISPLYYFVLFLWFKVVPHLGHGPNWLYTDRHSCDKYWWTNVLYINNFHPDYNNICFIISWYLAVDTQLFIFVPIFLYLLYYYWPAGVAALLATLCASWTTTGIIAGVNEYNANAIKDGFSGIYGTGVLEYPDSRTDIYEKPYCRAGAYLVGMLLGFVLHKKWEPTKNLRVRIPFYGVMWILAVVLCITPVYGLYGSFNGHEFSDFENITYFMFSATGYSIGLSCVIYACHNGYGFIINTILSWKLWVPLGRLTFAAYLIHVPLYIFYFATLQTRVLMTDYLTILAFVANVGLSYSVALVIVALVEYPFTYVVLFVYKVFGFDFGKERKNQKKKKALSTN